MASAEWWDDDASEADTSQAAVAHQQSSEHPTHGWCVWDGVNRARRGGQLCEGGREGTDLLRESTRAQC